MTANVSNVTEQTFQAEVLESDRPVLVDFYADWCGPCRAVAPVVESVASDYAGRLDVRKVDIDSAQELAGRYNIRSIPTLIVFENGEPRTQLVGAMSRAELANAIDPLVAA
ncbi:MAG: thioredoxin [Pseudomonadota bacterium]